MIWFVDEVEKYEFCDLLFIMVGNILGAEMVLMLGSWVVM